MKWGRTVTTDRPILRFVRWSAYGYALGLVGWLGLLAALSVANGSPGTGEWAGMAVYGLIWAGPWSVAGGLTGLAAGVTGPRVAIAAAVVGLMGGLVCNFLDSSTFDGWLALTVPAYGLPGLLGAVAVVALVGGVRRGLVR